MTTLFISDLHLDESRPEVTHAFLDFLHRASATCNALYILGDLFESWIGDDDDAPLGGHISRALKAFSATGTKVYFMHGNRDFLLGSQYCKRSNMTPLHDPTLIDLAGRRTILMHGDSLCTRDGDYQAFRRQVRDPEYQKNLLAESLESRRDLAQNLRAMSADATSNKAADIMDVTESEVISIMQDNTAELLIHGHTHRPKRHAVNLARGTGERIVLGDWHRSGWYLEVNAQSMELVEFSIDH